MSSRIDSVEYESQEPEPRSIEVSFPSAEEFTREYRSHIAEGGLFVETPDPFELRSRVRVRIDLVFCGESVEIEGEIVNCVPTSLGGEVRPGVAIQLDWPVDRLRELLGAFASGPSPPGQTRPAERRKTSRAPVKLLAKLETRRTVIAGRTRDLSLGGALVSVSEPPPPVGASIRMMISHPNGAGQMVIPASIARHVKNERGEVTAVGIRFEPGEDRKGETERFIEEVAVAERARRIGGISGEITDQGLSAVLDRFGKSSRLGTLTVSRGAEEGVISFEDGHLRLARLGQASGIEALARVLAWRDGAFEFHARSEGPREPAPSQTLDAAVAQALEWTEAPPRQASGGAGLDAVVRLAADGFGEGGAELTALEKSILDLAATDVPLRRVLETIPEDEVTIRSALQRLLEDGWITVST